MQAIRLALGKRGDVFLFRNNNGALRDKEGRLIRYGLGEGSSDLIGWTVRDGKAIFTAIEVKIPGHRTDPDRLEKQTNFIAVIKSAGGIAGFAETVEESEDIINGTI